jgi:Nucleotide-diphospho-sugar transferase
VESSGVVLCVVWICGSPSFTQLIERFVHIFVLVLPRSHPDGRFPSLLTSVVCNAHRKGLEDVLANVLLFCTDEETCELAQSLGLTTFFDEQNFGRLPKRAARAYADATFMEMMGAKVYCVQMVSMLGYDILFQDVDVVWYRDPLPWFLETADDPQRNFDVYFQDDGNHAVFYAPYSANTGFYYVRNNDRTRYFLNSLLMAGDLIISSRSHQIALVALLNEHASMYGLRVKVWERNLEEFPGGYSFHRKPDFMRKVVQGKAKPYIFHMSWTLNKDNKLKYFQQMGEWYLKPECAGRSARDIRGGVSVDGCCSFQPEVTCYYRDKPSKIPCREFPPIDKNGRSFW